MDDKIHVRMMLAQFSGLEPYHNESGENDQTDDSKFFHAS
jgi:hypothetical protein